MKQYKKTLRKFRPPIRVAILRVNSTKFDQIRPIFFESQIGNEPRNSPDPRESPFGTSPVNINCYIGMADKKKHSLEILIGIGLVLAVLAVYLPVIWLDFTNYDDPHYVLENAAIQDGVTWPAVQWAFTHSHSANWHPVTWISHMLDCQLYGLKPAGHHLTSVLFHTANTLLLFGLLNSLTGA